MLGAAPPDAAKRLPLDRRPTARTAAAGAARSGRPEAGRLGRAAGPRPRGALGALPGARGRRRRAARRRAHVLVRDAAAGPRPADARQVHAELAREPAGRRAWRRAAGRPRARPAPGRRPARRRAGRARARRRRRRRAPGGAGPVAEAQQDRADLHALAGLDVDGGHAPAERRGQLDLGLLGLHEEDGLVLLDLVALGDEDADDLRLGEAFAEVGQLEVFRHRTWRRGASPAPARRRASPGRRAARGPDPAASRARARSPGRRCRTR